MAHGLEGRTGMFADIGQCSGYCVFHQTHRLSRYCHSTCRPVCHLLMESSPNPRDKNEKIISILRASDTHPFCPGTINGQSKYCPGMMWMILKQSWTSQGKIRVIEITSLTALINGPVAEGHGQSRTVQILCRTGLELYVPCLPF